MPAPPTKRPKLTRDAIVEAAIALADADGLGAVTIRGVAAALDARPMSLYPHIGSKDDLVDLMSDAVAGETLLDAVPADWRDALRAIAEHTRAATLRHPWQTEALLGSARPATYGPNLLRHAEQSLAAIADLGLSAEQTRAILLAVDTYTMGQVATELALQDRQLIDADAWQAASATYLDPQAAAAEFPHLRAEGTATILAGMDHAEAFRLGLEWLLDGFAASLGR